MIKKQKGYTLIELLAVIAIIIIVASTFSIDIKEIFVRAKLNGAARILVNEIRYTQQLAIANKGDASIFFNKTNNIFRISQATKIIKEGKLPEGVSFYAIGFGPENKEIYDRCVYNLSGNPNYGGSIYIKCEEEIYTITVLPTTGRVIIYEFKKV